jgi:UDP-glucose 4-epimerase
VSGRSWCIVGGAGFIGSHFAERLLSDPETRRVVIYDNFSSGTEWHLAAVIEDPRLEIVRGDVKELETLTAAMQDVDSVIHLASNPDIAKAATQPDIDFWEGTFLTNQVLEAMRLSGASRLMYASGSGVYGDLGDYEAEEDFGPLVPTSTYGASKLAGEALIASYCAMFDLTACAFRFGNVVGRRQTHGVGYDFVRRLQKDPSELRILGNGTQSKSYIHVSDVINAVLLAHDTETKQFRAFNVATGDYITVREIAELAVDVSGLALDDVRFDYTGGDRGWKGDVPIVRLNTDRIQSLGWTRKHSSGEALRVSMQAMLDDLRAGIWNG